MWLVFVPALTVLVALSHGQANVLTPVEGDVLQLSGFGAGLTPSLLPELWDAEGVYVANHSSMGHRWWHATRPNLLLTYDPSIAAPTAPRRWIVLEIDPNEGPITRNSPLTQLPHAGPRPWERRGGSWLARDCMGTLRDTPARLSAVTELRQQDSCSTLRWRLVGLGEQNPSLAPLAGRFRVTGEYSSGAPVYRSDSGTVLQRIVSGTRSRWVLRTPDNDEIQMDTLDEFSDRINLIRTERFVAASLPDQDFRDKPAFICEPSGWTGGDGDFTLPDLDGYTPIDDISGQAPWSRQQFTDEDRESYELAYGGRPEQHARLMVVENVTRTSLHMVKVSLESPPVQLTGTGCAIFRLRNNGFRLTVTLRRDDGRSQDLIETASSGGWRDLAVSLPGSGHVILAASNPNDLGNRLAVSQAIMFNETCDQLQGRESSCQSVTCQNGGTCASVTIKHALCLCQSGFIGSWCETRVDCGKPPEIAFGAVTHRSGTGYLDRAFYRCEPGHEPAETVFDLAWSTCHYDGSWVNIPRCQPLADAHQPYMECDFGEDCDAFNTRVDNYYNTNADKEWQYIERLQTADIRPQGLFLAVYRASGRRTITARLLTPCLDLPEPGCLWLDLHLSNATLRVKDLSPNRLLFKTAQGSRRKLIPLKARVGPLMLVVRLMQGESEAALDTIQIYRETCEELLELNNSEGVTWPTWPPPEQMDQPMNETERRVNTSSTSTPQSAPILLVLVPLIVLLGLLMVPCCSKD